MAAVTASTRSAHDAAAVDGGAAGQVEQDRARLVQQVGDPAAVVEHEIGHQQPDSGWSSPTS